MLAAIIQARCGSTRLPNKVFADINGHPLIWHVVNRLRPSKLIDRIVIATTTNILDDSILAWCLENNVACFRGDENDVLSRYYHAAKDVGCSEILRVTADDPCKDWKVIDQVIQLRRDRELDFAFNNQPPTFPEGLDTEVFTFSALTKAFVESKLQFEREHVTQYFFKNPEMFLQDGLKFKTNVSNIRLTIDTEKDLEMTRVLYEKLSQGESIFLLPEILALAEASPAIFKINADVPRSTMYLGV